MKNQHLDSKISSIPSRVLGSKIPILLGLLFVTLLMPQLAFADVYVPLHEYLGYFDSNGIYTVVGNVKNTNDFGITPTIGIDIFCNASLHKFSCFLLPILLSIMPSILDCL